MSARSSIAGGISVALLAAAPFLVHQVTFGTGTPWRVGPLAAIQITAIVWLSTRNWSLRNRAILELSLISGLAIIMTMPGLSPRLVGLTVTGCCHTLAYVSLLAWFATSLRPNHEPLVTSLARRMRRTMPDKVVLYTRQVTIAWCVFFTGQLAVSILLLLLALVTIWSTFVNLLNLPLLAAMVMGEFTYRLILFRHEPHTSLIDTLSALHRVRFVPATRPVSSNRP